MMKLDANICNPETSSSGNQFPSTTYIHIYLEERKRKNITKQNKQTYKLQTLEQKKN
jgi:hypothetical protein